RTLDTLPYTHFPGVLLQPLGHLTKFLLLEVAFGARCACILPTSSVGSLSVTSPNFGLLFNVLSQHFVRCAVALERGVMYGIRRHAVNAIFHFLRSFAHYPNQVTKNMPFRIPFNQFPAASCKCSPLSASSSEP
ncbi:hypothetical protein, partial [Aeromonas dhakensis]|uniref:hypothetical protein n=1 Tax=Aeromonas dhakensis TaxID=196024 RepID=UPI003F743C2D